MKNEEARIRQWNVKSQTLSKLANKQAGGHRVPWPLSPDSETLLRSVFVDSASQVVSISRGSPHIMRLAGRRQKRSDKA